MISKTLLKIDIIGQSLIIGGMLLYCIIQPAAFFIILLLTFFFLGFWQFCNGLIQAISYQDKKRIKYVLISIVYIIGFVVLAAINDSFTREVNGFFMKFLVGVYFIGGCIGLASWYYYNTYQELKYDKHPRTFWDYEF
ncbi:MAG: hypothetical protein AB8G11_05685 [Saprospiraceae bacterium]